MLWNSVPSACLCRARRGQRAGGGSSQAPARLRLQRRHRAVAMFGSRGASGGCFLPRPAGSCFPRDFSSARLLVPAGVAGRRRADLPGTGETLPLRPRRGGQVGALRSTVGQTASSQGSLLVKRTPGIRVPQKHHFSPFQGLCPPPGPLSPPSFTRSINAACPAWPSSSPSPLLRLCSTLSSFFLVYCVSSQNIISSGGGGGGGGTGSLLSPQHPELGTS